LQWGLVTGISSNGRGICNSGLDHNLEMFNMWKRNKIEIGKAVCIKLYRNPWNPNIILFKPLNIYKYKIDNKLGEIRMITCENFHDGSNAADWICSTKKCPRQDKNLYPEFNKYFKKI
jgi:hypothetical protein